MTIFPHSLTTHKVDYARIAHELGRYTLINNPILARSGLISVPEDAQNIKNAEFSTQRRGLNRHRTEFLLRTSLNVVLDQES